MSIKALLTRILETFHAPIIMRTYSLTGQSSTTWYKNFPFHVAVTGYTPISLAGITFNQAGMKTYWWNIDSDNNVVNIGASNSSQTGQLASLNITIKVVYIKTELLG